MNLARSPLAADFDRRWDASYRAFNSVVDRWQLHRNPDADDQADLLVLGQVEMLRQAMRGIYAVMCGIPWDNTRMGVIRRIPAASPKWKSALRFVRSLAGSGPAYKPPIFLNPGNDICIFHRCELSSLYASRRQVTPLLMSHSDWFDPGKSIDDAGCHGFGSEVQDLLVEAMSTAAVAAGLERGSDVAEFICRVQTIARRLDFHRSSIERQSARLPLEFWSGTMGHPLNRVFGRAVRRKGGVVVGFDHGTGTGMWHCDFQARLEFDLVQRFMTFGPDMAAGLKANAESCGGRFASVDIQSLAPAAVPARRRSPDVPDMRQVLYVAAAVNDNNFVSPPLYDNNRITEWQGLLLSELTRLDLGVGIKPHPNTSLDTVSRFHTELGVRIVSGDFNANDWPDAVLVFDCPQTTVFREALIGGLPIVVIDLPRLTIRAEARELLARRVAFVRGWLDTAGRLQADWAELERAVRAAPALTDDAAVRAYFGAALQAA